jgi:putative glutamine amidotransferase
MGEIVIGITDCGSYKNYENWTLKEPGVRVVKLSHTENNIHDIKACDGIVLSGGEDIHPRYYNREDFESLCTEIVPERDSFEWEVLQYTDTLKLPLLGICRGLQVANVFFGGTLIPDIPTFGKYNHSKFPNKDRYHLVEVDQNSWLNEITGGDGEVNSSHHQSADRVGKGLAANCFSPDGIIEGIERMKKENQPYLMLVQWHPERMTDQESPFSKNIRKSFVEAVRKQVEDRK